MNHEGAPYGPGLAKKKKLNKPLNSISDYRRLIFYLPQSWSVILAKDRSRRILKIKKREKDMDNRCHAISL